jgi:hypothetical protein
MTRLCSNLFLMGTKECMHSLQRLKSCLCSFFWGRVLSPCLRNSEGKRERERERRRESERARERERERESERERKRERETLGEMLFHDLDIHGQQLAPILYIYINIYRERDEDTYSI